MAINQVCICIYFQRKRDLQDEGNTMVEYSQKQTKGVQIWTIRQSDAEGITPCV